MIVYTSSLYSLLVYFHFLSSPFNSHVMPMDVRRKQRGGAYRAMSFFIYLSISLSPPPLSSCNCCCCCCCCGLLLLCTACLLPPSTKRIVAHPTGWQLPSLEMQQGTKPPSFVLKDRSWPTCSLCCHLDLYKFSL